MLGSGAATAPVGRAEGHAVAWRAACRGVGASATRPICKRRDRQLDGPNAPGWVASEERAATSVRRVGGEATLRALVLAEVVIGAKN
jgi:ribosomal protein S8E